jgi:type IV secretion system protein VirB10
MTMTDQHDTQSSPSEAAGQGDDPFAARRAAGDPGGPRSAGHGPVQGERGISPVAGRMSSPQAKIAGIAGMVGVAALLIGVTWDRGDAKPTKPKDPARQTVRYDQVASTDAPPLPPAPTLGSGAVDPLTGQPLPPGQVVPAPVAGPGSGGSAGAGAPRESLADLTRRAPMIAYSQGGGPRGAGAGGAEAILASAQGAAPRQPTELENLRRGSAITTARATALGDRNFLILAGTQIPCVLQTAMDSSLPGYTTCVIPRDVLSDNGRVVLLEKGTKVLGEYRGGMQRGQRRLFILWTRAVTPRGIAIDLASPGADALGRSGFGGEVDNRFFERFGAALLLSLVDDGVYAATSGNGRNYQNTARVPSDVANTALEGSINIPPILRKNQGEDVGIMVAQDFDFSDVYGVKAR